MRRALEEELGPGDLTTMSTVPVSAVGRARIVAKQSAVVSGQAAAAEVFRQVAERVGGELRYEVVAEDGASVEPGDELARLEGSLRVVLIGERVALNLLMKLAGIATNARRYAAAAAGGTLRVVDTRKTTPLYRLLEKAAVRHDGCANHRFGLFDGVLIKDNHIVAARGVRAAVETARAAVHHLVKIQVEVTTLDELDEALAAGADALLLDNMDDALLAAAVGRARERRPEVVLEASGNMEPVRIARIRDLGLDVVSAGGVIHQARWVDLSLKIVARAG